MDAPTFFTADYPEPHAARTRAILERHPDVRQLFGRNPMTALIAIVLVAAQLTVAALLSQSPWWLIVTVAFAFGAFVEHTLFVIIHEATHNLVLRRASWNKAVGLLANLSGVVPCAIGFRNFHLLHHRFQGELGWDADLAGPREAAWVGRSSWRKALWLACFPLVEGILRPNRVKRVNVLEPWGLANAATCLGVAAGMWLVFGGLSVAYLTISLFFSIGLHPLGGRWIQEHFIFVPGQETYSYYGPAGPLALHVGHHNEHHDFMMIPWNNLPKLRKLAPEFYDDLHAHTSWTKAVWRFLSDPQMTLFSRVVRPDHDVTPKSHLGSKDTQKIIDDAVSMTSENG